MINVNIQVIYIVFSLITLYQPTTSPTLILIVNPRVINERHGTLWTNLQTLLTKKKKKRHSEENLMHRQSTHCIRPTFQYRERDSSARSTSYP